MHNYNKIKILLTVILIVLLISGCSFGNVEDVKQHADEIFNKHGFDVVGYQGYGLGPNPWPTYGGAYVWFTIKKQANGIVYEAALQRWGSEYHLYSLSAIDAIKPN